MVDILLIDINKLMESLKTVLMRVFRVVDFEFEFQQVELKMDDPKTRIYYVYCLKNNKNKKRDKIRILGTCYVLLRHGNVNTTFYLLIPVLVEI